MSGSDAKTQELAKIVGIFATMGLKNGQTTEMKVKEGSEVEESGAENVNVGSKLEDHVVEMDSEGHQYKDGSQNSIQSLFEPEANLNEYVIAEIAKFLNFKDLQSFRQVDTLWSAGVSHQFIRNSVFVLSSGERMEGLEGFERDTKDFGRLTALRIRLFAHDGFKEKAQRFNDILAHLSPRLKSLELKVRAKDTIFLPRATVQFPALKSLTINARLVDNENVRQFVKLLYPSAPNLVELVVWRLTSAILSPLLTDDDDGSVSRNWSLAPKLKSLRIRNYICSKELSIINKFPQNWERLEMKVGHVGRLHDNTFELLDQLLEDNKDALVSLNLEMNMNASKCNPQTLEFPNTFSKLQELKLQFVSIDDLVDFGGEVVNYCKRFPSLSSLFLVSRNNNLESLTEIWSFFFPPQVFKGLKYLEMKLEENYNEFLVDKGIDENWAEKMFPNAAIRIII